MATSDARIRERTGRGWEEWFDLLDDAGMSGRPHREVARWVAAQLGVVPLAWPAQAVTGSYERARGGRAVGEHEDGFTVSVSRTIAVPAETAFDALVDPERRARWLDTDLHVRTSTRPRSARFDHVDGRVAVTIDAKDAGRCTVTVAHSRLADAGLADKTRARWRERLDALKAVLGAGTEKADA
ncbi:hypothetical protein BJF78_17775 [Pseudonocardia sp. CNS-139]|nr:hypothetical protein BJF78_17775 [Pseudonocardia sp. CNS-139]